MGTNISHSFAVWNWNFPLMIPIRRWVKWIFVNDIHYLFQACAVILLQFRYYVLKCHIYIYIYIYIYVCVCDIWERNIYIYIYIFHLPRQTYRNEQKKLIRSQGNLLLEWIMWKHHGMVNWFWYVHHYQRLPCNPIILNVLTKIR